MQAITKINNHNVKILLIKISLIICIVIFTRLSYSHNLPTYAPVPGGIAVIPLDLHNFKSPVVFFNDKRVLVTKYQDPEHHHNHWIAVIGIPITIKPGLHKISIYSDPIDNNNFKNMSEKSFLVYNKQYPHEKLRLKPQLVTPSEQEHNRISKEHELIQEAYSYWSNQVPNLKLQPPIVGRISSTFGLKRIFNGQHKGHHSGIDLAAPTGTEVYATASGQIILTGHFFYTGNVVFIDHGQGLITSYAHLDKIAVKEGDLVTTDTIIGMVGATGRATGSHLHWSISLNDARIDPELFLNTIK